MFNKYLLVPVAAFVLCSVTTMAAPVIKSVPWSSSPPVPDGLKVTCMQSANRLDSSGTCPVIEYDNKTFWAYSHKDNRLGMTLVGYDSSGQVVEQIVKPGARYVWQITSNPDTRMVRLWGQGGKILDIEWDELGSAAEGIATNRWPEEPASSTASDLIVHAVVEDRPEPVGGYQTFEACLKNRLKYPDLARSNGVEGTVMVEFVVERTGTVSNVRAIRDIGAQTGKAAEQVIKECSRWAPGLQRGRVVRTQLVQPVQFRLE